MLLRVRLGIQKGCFINYIVLHMVAFQAVKECADNEFQLLGVLRRGQHGRRHFLVQQHAARDLMGGELGYALEDSSWAMLVHGVCGRASLCQGLLCMTSVRRRHGAKTLSDVCGDRGRSAVADAADRASAEAGVLILFHLIQVRCVSVHHKLIDIIVVIAVLRRVVYEHLADSLSFFTGKVISQSIHELVSGNLLLLVHKFLDRGEAVRHVRDADLQAGDEIVNGAALLDGLAASQAVLGQAGAEDIRNFALTGQVNGVLYDDACAGQFPDRAVPGLHQLVKRFHIPKVTVILHKSLAAGHVDSVVHDHEQDSGEVEVAHAGAAIAPLTGNRGLHTADRGIAVGILFFDALFNEGGNDYFVIVEGRHAGSEF